MIRSYAEQQRAPKLAAVFGIIGFVDVPIVYFSVRWWRTMHPGYIVRPGGGLGPKMLSSLIVSVVAFTILYVIFLNLRIWIKGLENRIDSLEEEAGLN
jgi:heme exporter protein C